MYFHEELPSHKQRLEPRVLLQLVPAEPVRPDLVQHPADQVVRKPAVLVVGEADVHVNHLLRLVERHPPLQHVVEDQRAAPVVQLLAVVPVGEEVLGRVAVLRARELVEVIFLFETLTSLIAVLTYKTKVLLGSLTFRNTIFFKFFIKI